MLAAHWRRALCLKDVAFLLVSELPQVQLLRLTKCPSICRSPLDEVWLQMALSCWKTAKTWLCCATFFEHQDTCSQPWLQCDGAPFSRTPCEKWHDFCLSLSVRKWFLKIWEMAALVLVLCFTNNLQHLLPSSESCQLPDPSPFTDIETCMGN